MHRHTDNIALDLETILSWYGDEAAAINAAVKIVLPVSPHSPCFIVAMAQYAEADKSQLEKWEVEYGFTVLKLAHLENVLLKQNSLPMPSVVSNSGSRFHPTKKSSSSFLTFMRSRAMTRNGGPRLKSALSFPITACRMQR